MFSVLFKCVVVAIAWFCGIMASAFGISLSGIYLNYETQDIVIHAVGWIFAIIAMAVWVNRAESPDTKAAITIIRILFMLVAPISAALGIVASVIYCIAYALWRAVDFAFDQVEELVS